MPFFKHGGAGSASSDETTRMKPVGGQALQAAQQSASPTDDTQVPLEFIAARKRARRNKYIKRGAIVGVIVVALAAGSFTLSSANNQPEEAPTTQSYTQAVEKGTLALTIEGSGTLAAASTTSATAKVSGEVKKVYVEEGDSVSKGDTLFTLTSDSLSDAVTDAKKKKSSAYSSYSEAKSNLSKAKAALKKAKKAAAKAKKAAAKASKASSASSNNASGSTASDSSSNSQLSESTSAVQSAEENVTKATESLSSAKSGYEDACDSYTDAIDALDDLTVTASEAGTVTAVNVAAGDQLSTESSDAAVTISNTDTMTLAVNVSEYDIGNIKKGQSAKVKVTALDKETSATVSKVSSTANESNDSSTAYYTVTLKIKKPSSGMLAGMNATATITYKEYKNALLVPTSAVSTQGDSSTVTVQADDGSTSQVAVTVKGSDDETSAVASDELSEGDKIVVNYQVNTDSSDSSQSDAANSLMSGMGSSDNGGQQGAPGGGNDGQGGGQGGSGGGQGGTPPSGGGAPSGN
ncbi:MAG: HlyD family efflux transporter periplasmic adaptor subunit [Coriobacteriia bacterium]|nr:HlyD family efflux transporter periplasmic adaptor subunit [Coriobacteriia bacterium]